MRRLPALTSLVLAACASSPQAPDVTVQPMSTQVILPGGAPMRIGQTAENVGIVSQVPVTPDSAWSKLQLAYADLQITADQVDARSRTIAVSGAKIRRRLGGVPLTRYLSCGNKDGQPNAETYDVVLTLQSTVAPGTNGGSRITTIVAGVASDPFHSDSNSMICTSTSAIEKRLVDFVTGKPSK